MISNFKPRFLLYLIIQFKTNRLSYRIHYSLFSTEKLIIKYKKANIITLNVQNEGLCPEKFQK